MSHPKERKPFVNFVRRDNSKALAESLLNKVPPKPVIPPRQEVIEFFAKRKCYPRGWRKILDVGDAFAPSLGGIGEKPVVIEPEVNALSPLSQ